MERGPVRILRMNDTGPLQPPPGETKNKKTDEEE